MATMNISGKTHAVSDRAETFLSNYLTRVRRYVDNNGIGAEYLEDIENRISEKLSSLSSEATEGDGVRIVNEIGEPEDIFADVPKKPRGNFDGVKESVRQNLKSPLYRDSSKGIIFGVCAGLGDKFDIDPFFVRLLFVILFFFYGTGVFAYLVLAVLMKDRASFDKADTPKAEKRSSALGELPNRASGVIGRFARGIGRLVSFGFFGILALCLGFVSIGFFVASGISASEFVIDNQSLFANAHPLIPYSAGIAGITLFVLAWVSMFKAFGKSVGNGLVLLASGILLAFAMAAGAYGTIKTVSNYVQRESFVERISTDVSSGVLVLDFSKNENPRSFELRTLEWTVLRIEKSEEKNVRIETETEFSAQNRGAAEFVYGKTAKLAVTGTGNILSVSNVRTKFDSVVPFSFPTRTIIVKIPKNVALDLRNVPEGVRTEGIHRTQLDGFVPDSYETRISRECRRTVARYSEKADSFICDPKGYDEETLKSAKLQYLEMNHSEFIPQIESNEEGRYPYTYNDETKFKSLSGGLYQGTFVLNYEHPADVPNEINKTFRISVDEEGMINTEEVSSDYVEKKVARPADPHSEISE